VIVPGGIPVDLDAISRAQHEAAMGPATPAAPALVQIGNAATEAPKDRVGQQTSTSQPPPPKA
jgi:hypothetical protein